MSFAEVADRVYVLAYPVCNVNSILITGGEKALLVDTLSTDAQARELRDAARRVTTLPVELVNTHFHFDHAFGNATLAEGSTPIWGHPDCARELRERGDHWRRHWRDEIATEDEELADQVGSVHVVPPDRLVAREALIDLGGREVTLSHHGRGHTDGDLVVRLDGVLIAGDLLEEGASPGFGDGYPLEWPETLANLIRLTGPATTVIPGHGKPVDVAFMRQQHEDLTRLDWLIRDGHRDGAPVERVAAASPFAHFGEPGRYQSELAVKRGYAQLAGG